MVEFEMPSLYYSSVIEILRVMHTKARLSSKLHQNFPGFILNRKWSGISCFEMFLIEFSNCCDILISHYLNEIVLF